MLDFGRLQYRWDGRRSVDSNTVKNPSPNIVPDFALVRQDANFPKE